MGFAVVQYVVLSSFAKFFFEIDVDGFVLQGFCIDDDEFLAGDAFAPTGRENVGGDDVVGFCDFFEWGVANNLEVAV